MSYICLVKLKQEDMDRLKKAQKQIAKRNIDTRITNGTLYVCIEETELELADFEIDYQAKEFDNEKEEA